MPGGPHPPLSVVEEWLAKSNPAHPSETRGLTLVVVVVVTYALAVLTVLARVRARFAIQHNAGADDALVIFAMLPLTGLAISTCLASRRYGFDRHAWDLTPEMAVNSRKMVIAMEFNYILALCLVKISILMFYRRLADGSISKTFRRIVQASIIFIIVYLVVSCVLLLVSCRPFNAYWDSVDFNWVMTHKEGVDWTCFDEGAYDITVSVISIVQDFLACGLPTILLWKLQLPLRQKIALGAIFGVGFFLCITGILRVFYLHRTFYETYDVTWAAEDAWLWTAVEASLAVICASAPALKVFFQQVLNGSSFASRIQDSFRRNGYERNGSMGTYNANGLPASGRALGAKKVPRAYWAGKRDIGLGGIEVIKEVDIDSESSRPHSPPDRDHGERSQKLAYQYAAQISRAEAPSPEAEVSVGKR